MVDNVIGGDEGVDGQRWTRTQEKLLVPLAMAWERRFEVAFRLHSLSKSSSFLAHCPLSLKPKLSENSAW